MQSVGHSSHRDSRVVIRTEHKGWNGCMLINNLISYSRQSVLSDNVDVARAQTTPRLSVFVYVILT